MEWRQTIYYSDIAAYSWALIETLRSSFTANGERLGVTWPEPDVMFEVFDLRYEHQEIGFHVIHLPKG